MGLFLQHKTVDMQWSVWKMEESLDTLFSLLPDVRRVSCEQEMQRFTSDRRKLEWLSVRVLLYSMLQEDKEIGYSSEGKPHLTDNSSFISISHTKGYVAVILSSVAPVGIDIEQYGQRVKRVYDRFIRSDERVEPYQGDETWSMLLHWSAKETIFKSMETLFITFHSSERRSIPGAGVCNGTAAIIHRRLPYLSGLCFDVDCHYLKHLCILISGE